MQLFSVTIIGFPRALPGGRIGYSQLTSLGFFEGGNSATLLWIPALGVWYSAPVFSTGPMGGGPYSTEPAGRALPYKFEGARSTALREWWTPYMWWSPCSAVGLPLSLGSSGSQQVTSVPTGPMRDRPTSEWVPLVLSFTFTQQVTLVASSATV